MDAVRRLIADQYAREPVRVNAAVSAALVVLLGAVGIAVDAPALAGLVALLVNGLSNREIADQLMLGEETVKTHLRHIYKKLDVSDRVHAVAIVLRQGIFT